MVSDTRRNVHIDRDDIKMTDRQIAERYLGLDTFPCSVCSPLRDDDKNPSFSFTERDGIVFWKDFGTGASGNLITLMAKLWDCDYSEALYKIKLDYDLKIPDFRLIRRYRGKIHVTSSSKIDVRTRDWKPWDVEYWKSYGISKKFCQWCNVYPISHAFFTKPNPKTGQEETITVPMEKYAYAYFEWKDGEKSIKLYQPYSQRMKWLSKHDASVWDLWKHAFNWADKNSDETVIITSSRKDAMCLWENLRIPAMALQGEGYLPKPHVMQQVLDRFQNVYIWYDNDFSHEFGNPGQDNAKKLIDLYPTLKNICIPQILWCKDPSDLVKSRGVNTLKEVWNQQK